MRYMLQETTLRQDWSPQLPILQRTAEVRIGSARVYNHMDWLPSLAAPPHIWFALFSSSTMKYADHLIARDYGLTALYVLEPIFPVI